MPDKISITDVHKDEMFFEIKVAKVFLGNRKEVCDIYREIDIQLSKLWKLKHLSWKEYMKYVSNNRKYSEDKKLAFP